MKPTLFVLAAGMGSRYGGLKQLDGLGPNSETIMTKANSALSFLKALIANLPFISVLIPPEIRVYNVYRRHGFSGHGHNAGSVCQPAGLNPESIHRAEP